MGRRPSLWPATFIHRFGRTSCRARESSRSWLSSNRQQTSSSSAQRGQARAALRKARSGFASAQSTRASSCSASVDGPKACFSRPSASPVRSRASRSAGNTPLEVQRNAEIPWEWDTFRSHRALFQKRPPRRSSSQNNSFAVGRMRRRPLALGWLERGGCRGFSTRAPMTRHGRRRGCQRCQPTSIDACFSARRLIRWRPCAGTRSLSWKELGQVSGPASPLSSRGVSPRAPRCACAIGTTLRR